MISLSLTQSCFFLFFFSYYRLAKAYQLSGDVEKAQEALRRGLSRPALAGDKSLLSLLNELDIQLD
jgi:hypothetical protein